MLKRIVVILLTLVCLFLFYTLYTLLERYEEERDLGWGREARQNPYLALKLYGEKRGEDITVSDSYLELGRLSNYQTLLITDSKLLLSERRSTEILDWVRDGGLLIVGVTLNSDGTDRLLETLGMTVEDSTPPEGSLHEEQKGEDDSPEEIAKKLGEELRRYNQSLNGEQEKVDENKPLGDRAKVAIHEDQVDSVELTELVFEGVDGVLQTHFDTTADLVHPSMHGEVTTENGGRLIYSEGSMWGTHFAQISVGSGVVSVFTGNAIFDSHNIGYFDHAHLWDVLGGGRESAVLYGSSMPGLGSILFRVMPELLLSGVLLIVMLIWYGFGFFGSKKDVRHSSRRAFGEHLTASAIYLWQKGLQQKLLTPVRESLKVVARRRFSDFDRVPQEEQARVLAKHSGMREDMVYKALFQLENLNDENFVKTVQVLQKIRGCLNDAERYK